MGKRLSKRGGLRMYKFKSHPRSGGVNKSVEA